MNKSEHQINITQQLKNYFKDIRNPYAYTVASDEVTTDEIVNIASSDEVTIDAITNVAASSESTSDEQTTPLWSLYQDLLSQYSLKLDIVYEDPTISFNNKYQEIYYWNTTLQSINP